MSGHARLFGIGLKHAFYSNGLCGDFKVAPDSATERLLKNHRCLVKPRFNGADVFVETGEDGKPKIRFAPQDLLAFELRLQNPEFPLFTDSAPLSGGADFAMIVTDQNAYRFNFSSRLEIRRDFNQTGGDSIELAFSAKPVKWIYYLVTDQPGAGSQFSIVAKDAPAVTWKLAAATDSMSLKLADQFPGMACHRFASEQLVPCRESGFKEIQLLQGGSTVIESLPNPSWRNYLQVEAANGTSVDAIFQIVKYSTNTT